MSKRHQVKSNHPWRSYKSIKAPKDVLDVIDIEIDRRLSKEKYFRAVTKLPKKRSL